jgi:hypothetical protein
MLSYVMQKITVTYNNHNYPCFYNEGYVFTDPAGGRHALGLAYANSSNNQNACISIYSINHGGDDQYRAYFPSSGSPAYIYVADADGTTYEFGLDPSTGSNIPVSIPVSIIEDRNGNTVNLSESQSNGAISYTDTLGRTVISNSGFGAAGADNTVTVSGLSEPYNVYWTSSAVSASYSVGQAEVSSDKFCGGLEPVSGSYPLIDHIELPNNVGVFQFEYDSTTPGSTTYGLLNKIIYPNGGYVRYAWGAQFEEERHPLRGYHLP